MLLTFSPEPFVFSSTVENIKTLSSALREEHRLKVRFGAFTAVTVKNAVFWDVMSYGSCTADVSDERIASIIRVTRTCELGTTLAVTSNLRTLRRSTVV
jgi:BRCT domain type II-containing protein